MNNIVERLRDDLGGGPNAWLKREAADLIESQAKRIAELEAANARLKTVPMKYRRMEFNAQLQQRIAELERENAQAKEAIATLNAGKPLGEIVGLHTAQNALARVKELEADYRRITDMWAESRNELAAATKRIAELEAENTTLANTNLRITTEWRNELAALIKKIEDAPVVMWVHKDNDLLIRRTWPNEEGFYAVISKEDLK